MSTIQAISQKSESANHQQEIALEIQDTIICPICFGQYPSTNIQTISHCKHSFCSDCLKEYLTTKIKALNVLKLNCPQSECKEILSDEMILKVLGPKEYNKYRELALKKIANRDLKNRFCPKPGCSKPFTANKKETYSICVCRTKICNTCSNFWHEGKSCLEAIDPEFELYSKMNDIHFCILCKTAIKREEGCLHITCPICDYEWCWTCGREYRALHVCPGYWSPTPPSQLKWFSATNLKRTWRTSRLTTKIYFIIAAICIFPLLVIGFALFWPLFAFFNPETDLSRKKPFKSFFCILGSLLFAIFSLPVTVFYIIAFAGGFVVLAPFLLLVLIYKLIIKDPSPILEIPDSPNKRWLSGDQSKFVYTNNYRPNPEIKASNHESEKFGRQNVSRGEKLDIEGKAKEPYVFKIEEISRAKIFQVPHPIAEEIKLRMLDLDLNRSKHREEDIIVV